jgi:hypothetical protein
MLKLWRRHLPECPHIDKGRTWVKCACPIWVDGSLDGRRVRHSLDTLNWQRANQIVHDMESDLVVVKNSSISDAVPMFISDCERACSHEMGRLAPIKPGSPTFGPD